MTADFRSDTFTIPTQGMLEAMFSAQVGDDVWEEDPTVKQLESRMARDFGLDFGLFCPSGTMANQIALRIHTRPQDEVICDWFSHIHHYEAGGPASNSNLSLKLIQTDRGILSAELIESAINPEDVHFPPSRLVVLENTCNKGGGYSYELEDVKAIKDLCLRGGLFLHLDGARVFNAIISKGYSTMEIGSHLDSISICLSKGLGCPIGTVLLINGEEKYKEAKRVRKAFGGGMRQAGYLAAAGLYALDHQIDRLSEDHERARQIGDILKKSSLCTELKEIETNIVIFKSARPAPETIEDLKNQGILVAGMGNDWIRFVTYLGIEDEHIEALSNAVKAR